MYSVDFTCRSSCCSGVHATLRKHAVPPGLPLSPCFTFPSPRVSPKRVLIMAEERGICRISDIEFLWRCVHSCGDSSRAIPAPLPHPILSGASPLFQHGVLDSSTHAFLRVVLGTGAQSNLGRPCRASRPKYGPSQPVPVLECHACTSHDVFINPFLANENHLATHHYFHTGVAHLRRNMIGKK